MKIEYNGKEVEAYRLITKKKFAQEIFEGKKKVEIRAFSNFYEKMFFDPVKSAALSERIENGGSAVDESGAYLIDQTMKDIDFARLTNYNGSWYLDVQITSISVCAMVKEDIEYLNNSFEFHDYDEEYKKFENHPIEEVPMFFAIAIGDIVNSHGFK